jgi:putative endonuclease
MGSLSGTLYIGMTGNLQKRVFEHKFHRIEGFTDKYQVERLLYRESFDEVQKAINREKQLKGWRRSKKICADRIGESALAGFGAGVVSVDEGFG